MNKPFWEYQVSHMSDPSVQWVYIHLFNRALQTKENLTRYYNAGSLRPGIAIEDVFNKLKEYGGQLVKEHISNRHANPDWLYIWEDSGVAIEYWPKNREIMVTLVTLNSDLGKALHPFFDANIFRKQTKGRVYVVVSGQTGPRLHEMGVAGEDFIPSNYRPETVQKYRHVVEDLNRADPCGRIIVLNGPPRTGKTHMIRALLNEVPKATFVLVPSNFIASLGDPGFLSVLMREQKKDAPMVLILEDADEAMINRKEGNVSALSALLNFSDGIFGCLLDMRLVCTTNVELGDLDPAVIGDGRLCTHMEIGLLDTDMANAIFERLTGKKGDLKEKFYRLGTVYKLAKGNNAESAETIKPKRKLGFLPDKPDEFLAAMQTPEAREAAEKAFAATPEELGKASVQAFIDKEEEVVEIEAEEPELLPEHAGERLTAITSSGETIDVGYIDQAGNLVITDDSWMTDDDNDLIDEDPDDDEEMPSFFSADAEEGIDDDEDDDE